MALYLLDTDVVIDYLNKLPHALTFVTQSLEDADTLCTCEVVLAETYSGYGELRRREIIDFLDALFFLPATAETARQAGIWRFNYARQGRQLSTADTLIAAIAWQHRATIVTRNVRDYPMPEVAIRALRRQ